MLNSLRSRPVTAQLSANSSFQGLVSRSGDWPQNTLTGTICALSTAFCSSAPTSRTSGAGGVGRLRRPNQSAAGARKKNAAGSRWLPTATSATGRGSPALLHSVSSTARSLSDARGST